MCLQRRNEWRFLVRKGSYGWIRLRGFCGAIEVGWVVGVWYLNVDEERPECSSHWKLGTFWTIELGVHRDWVGKAGQEIEVSAFYDDSD